MRLLFDEQLSNRLPRLLADCYADSLHIESLELGGAPDVILWQAAVVQGFVLVTKEDCAVHDQRAAPRSGVPSLTVAPTSEVAREEFGSD